MWDTSNGYDTSLFNARTEFRAYTTNKPATAIDLKSAAPGPYSSDTWWSGYFGIDVKSIGEITRQGEKSGTTTKFYRTRESYNIALKPNSRTVAYNGCSPTSGSTSSQTYVYDTGLSSLSSNGFTKNGYRFKGWGTSCSASSTITSISATAYPTETSTLTLYALWEQLTPATLTCSNKTYNGSSQTACSCSGGTVGGSYYATNAGTYTASCTPDSSHTAPSNVQWTMSPKTLTVTADNKSKSYGAANPALTQTASGQVSGQTPGFTGTLTTDATTTSPVGSYDIKQGNLALANNGTFLASNYTMSFTKGTLTVTKVDATCPTTTAYSGTYDGNAHGIGVSGGSGGTIQYSTDNSTWDSTAPTIKNVSDSPKTVYVRVSGDGNHNTVTCGSKTITINKKTLTVTAADKTRAYGEANPTFTYTSSGTISGETPSFTGSLTTVATTTSPPGTYDITQGSLALTNSGSFIANNYTISYTKGTLTVTKADPTCPTLAAYSGTYDGSSHGISVTGGSGGTIQYKKGSTGSWSSTVPSIKNVENSPTTIYVQALGNDNYNTKDCGNATITINKKTLSVAAENKSKVYGEANPTLTYTYSGNVSGETPSFTGSLTTEATTSSAVGDYDINQGTLALADSGSFIANNYTMSYTKGTLSVTEPPASCPTLVAYSGTYDGQSHGITVSGGSGGTIQYRTSTTGTWSNTAPTIKNVSDSPTTVYVRVEGDANHSTVTCGNKTITINKKTLTVTAADKTRKYGQANPGFTYTSSGNLSGETPSFTGTLSTTATATSAPGEYDRTQGTLALADSGNFKAANYEISYTKGTLTITKGTCPAPTNVQISSAGKVTWTAASGAISYQISIDNTNWATAESGVDYKTAITGSSGERTVYVRSVCNSTNYDTPSTSTPGQTMVYTVTLTKGQGISTVTGSGNYISGSTVSIDATAGNNYEWSKWTETNGGSLVSATKNYSAQITKNWAYTANAVGETYTVEYNCGTGSGTPPASQTVRYGEEITMSNTAGGCVKTDYSLSQWNSPGEDGTGTHNWKGWNGDWNFQNGQYGITNKKLTLTAEWKEATFSPGITKTISNEKDIYKAGDTVTYNIKVSNDDDFAITNVVVEDPNATIVSGTGYTVNNSHKATIASIAAGGSVTINATRTITESDINTVTNTATITDATATGKTLDGTPEATKTVDVQNLIKITNTVKGNMAKTDEYFKVKVIISGSTGDTYTISGQSYTGDGKQTTYTVGQDNYIFIKHGEEITIGSGASDSKISSGITYRIIEEENDYETTINGSINNKDSGNLTTSQSNNINTLSIVNEKESQVPTGVIIKIVPYIIIASLAVIGSIVLINKKNTKKAKSKNK